jgi:uncharacterized membrane protein
MKLQKERSFLWASGFLTAIAVVHFTPFVVRHRLQIGEVWLTNTSAFWTAIICAVLAITALKLSRKPRKDLP